MKTCQGPGREVPPQADTASIGGILLSIASLLAFRKAQRRREKKTSMK